MEKTCRSCGGLMQEIRRETVNQTEYVYLRCEKCRKGIARREDG